MLKNLRHLVLDTLDPLEAARVHSTSMRSQDRAHSFQDAKAFLFRQSHFNSLRLVVCTSILREARHLRQWWGGGATRDLPRKLPDGLPSRPAFSSPLPGGAG